MESQPRILKKSWADYQGIANPPFSLDRQSHYPPGQEGIRLQRHCSSQPLNWVWNPTLS